jgi:sterol desaturase/sphingolipid hydroxylase (fatty acid hydroxylase superfamily)
MNLQSLIQDEPLWALYLAMFVLQVARYALIAGVPYLYLHRWRSDDYARVRIQSQPPPRRLLPQEIGYSLSTMAVFSLSAIPIRMAENAGWSKLYFDAADFGWPYFWFTVLGAIVVHDTYFYWTHRALHFRPLFRAVHVVHHRYTNPSPWAALSFHPLEGVVLFAVVPVMIVLVPLHPMSLVAFLTCMTAVSVIGHLGYELYPSGTTRHPLLGWLNTATHHNMHHRHVNCNFGLYFNFWDCVMGTNHPQYTQSFEEIKRGRAMAAADVEARPVGSES